MAADNWRELLRQDGVESVIVRAIRSAQWAMRHRPLIADDVESFAWDFAVTLAEKYPGPINNEEFLGWLYHGLTTYGLMQLTQQTMGSVGGPRFETMARTVSYDAHREEYGDTALDRAPSVFGGFTPGARRLTRDDPLAVLLHIERLERAVHQASIRASYGTTYATENSPYCIEPLCLAAPAQGRRGYCTRHYQWHRVRWGRPDGTSVACSEDGCEQIVNARGLCKMHYQRERQRRIDTGQPWERETPEPQPCAEPACDRTAKIKGRCKAHYQAARLAAQPPCLIPGCGKNALAKGMCSTHHKEARRHGGDRP